MKFNKILLIDDNDVDNYIHKQILTKCNICTSIVTMSSAIDALEYLIELKAKPDEVPEIIFLDIRMPGMDGFEFLDQYQKFPDSLKNRSRISMLTSSQDQEDVAKAKKYPGVQLFLNKPLSKEMVVKKITIIDG